MNLMLTSIKNIIFSNHYFLVSVALLSTLPNLSAIPPLYASTLMSPVSVDQREGSESEESPSPPIPLQDIDMDGLKVTQELALIVDSKGFSPKNIHVTQGIPVRLTLSSISKKPTCIIID